ncbi:MAG: hypothetical protein J7J07_03290, partial [Syntrophobacterales bacterium]|nr:hypothetical protein [Syntrophobacterales bacterium]
MNSVRRLDFSSFRPVCASHADRQKPESSLFSYLREFWTPPGLDPGSTRVTTFCETINVDVFVKSSIMPFSGIIMESNFY